MVYETSGLIFAYTQPHLSHSQPAKILSVRQYFRFPSALGPLYIWFTDTLLPAWPMTSTHSSDSSLNIISSILYSKVHPLCRNLYSSHLYFLV